MLMQITENDIKEVEQNLKAAQPIMEALGDEARIRILLHLLQGECTGSRVQDLVPNAGLSRAALSHHLQILKRAGLVNSRKEGTLVFYYLDPSATQILRLKTLADQIYNLIQFLPDRKGDELKGNKV